MDAGPSRVGPVAARKVVTTLFCDVAGSTALGERLDAEVVRFVLSRYFEWAAGVIERHGGTVEKFIGDAVMAVFGVPLLHEDDAVRACRAAQELLSELPRLNDELQRDFGTRLELRIGVNSGEVAVVADQLLATGDAVNVAARLEQATKPGQILIGPVTLALARHAVTVDPVAPLELKGKSRPLEAYRLIAVDPGRPRRPSGFDVPMVGRADEKERLEDAFRDVVARRACRLVTVLGTAGVGKSRLSAEFLAGIEARVVTGRCLSYGEGITYWPVVEVVKQLGDVGARLTGENPAVASAFGALMGEGATATADEIAWAVRRLFEEAAADRPLVVFFDDIHWGEPTFLDLVEHVADLSHDASILILCLARPELLEHRPAWSGNRPGATTMLLQPLDARTTAELIDRLIDPGELDRELALRIGAGSAGNPLFVEEMVAMARDSKAEELAVPPTIKALLAARIDQLDSAERGVLERGAVEGELFHRGAVEALVPSPEPVFRQLVALVRKELVRPDRPTLLAEDAYRFRHLLIRDAAYDALPKVARADLHERFAYWLEQHGTELVERDEIVGYHLEQAYRYRTELGSPDEAALSLASRASVFLTSGSRRARFRGDLAAAAGLLGRAASLGPARRLAILPELGELLIELGELERAAAVLDEALQDARAEGDERAAAIANMLRAGVSSHLGEQTTNLRVLQLAGEAETLLAHDGDRARLATVLATAGRHRFFLGRSREADETLERACSLALDAGDLPRAQACLTWRLAARGWGYASVSEHRATSSNVPIEFEDSLSVRYTSLLTNALFDALDGDFESARGQLVEADVLARELGGPLGAGRAMYVGDVELLAGDPGAAERVLREGFDRLGALGEAGFRSTMASFLAEALYRLGRDDEASLLLDVAGELAEPDDVDVLARSRAVRAKILARRGELAVALATAREAVDTAATTDHLVLHGDTLLALAEVLQAGGDNAGAADALREALELFERKENVVQAEQTRALLGDLERQRGAQKS